MSDIGHNSKEQLISFLERIEKLEEEKRELAEDIKDIYKEAKGVGFDVLALRRIIAMRRDNGEKWKAQREMLDLYMDVLGMK